MRDVYMHLPRLGWSHGGLLLVTCVPQSASPRTAANITTSTHTTHWDWRTANIPCGIELKFYVSFDMDKHLNLISSTFKILIILNKR